MQKGTETEHRFCYQGSKQHQSHDCKAMFSCRPKELGCLGLPTQDTTIPVLDYPSLDFFYVRSQSPICLSPYTWDSIVISTTGSC